MSRSRLPSLPTFRRHALAAATALACCTPLAQALTFSWTSGDFTPGVTAPSPLAAGDVLNIGAGGFKYFNSTTSNFSNSGTVNWAADALYLQSGALVTNNALWLASGDDPLFYNGGSAPSFTNNGVFRKNGGLGSTTINSGVGFVNNGTLDVQTGTLSFVGASVFNAGSVFSGAGVVNVSAGTNTFNGAFTSSNLLLSGGAVHQGVAAVVGGVVNLSGGYLSGGWTVASGQALNLTTGGFKYLDGASTVLTNQGTLTWNTGDALYLQSGATLRNEALFVANQSTALFYNGGSAPSFSNAASGTVRAAAGTTLTVNNGVGFVNNGGTLDAASGAAIRYVGGSVFNSGTTFTGAGSNVAAGNNNFNGSIHAGNLVFESGVHTGGAALVDGSLAWTGGYLTGTWTLAAGQTIQAQAGGFKYVDGAGAVLTNLGTVNWTTGDLLYLQSGAAVSNQGLWLASESTGIVYNGGAGPSFDNTGTVRAAAGKTLTIGAGAGFVNNGGTLDAASGAEVRFAGNSVFNSGSVFSGAGSNVAAGNNSFNGGFTSANLRLEGGVHTGNAALITGSVGWSGGYLTGTWTVAAGQTLQGQTGGFKYVDGAGAVLTNLGSVNWTSADALYLQSGGAISNQGLWLASESTGLFYNGGAGPAFDNTPSGTVRAAAGKTLTIGAGLGFVNNGGVLDALAGGSIVYNGGSQFNAGTRFTGAGSNVVTGNNQFSGGFSSSNLVLQSGIHTGNSAALTGSAVFSGGTLTGSWQVGAGQTLAAQTGAFKYLDAGALSNNGTLAWNTGDFLYMQSGAALNNAGTLNFSADGGVLYNGGAGPSFVNTGLISKTGGSGVTTIGDNLGFNNLGTIDVLTGAIALPGNFSNNGRLQGVGSYRVAGTLSNAGTVAPGSAAPGTLGLEGDFLQAAGGHFAIGLQSLANHGLFNISGTAALGGALDLSCFGACSLAVGDVVTILDSVGDLSGSFASITLNGFGTGAFNVVYDTVADRVQLVVTQSVTGVVPEPQTYALMLAGLALLGWRARRRG